MRTGSGLDLDFEAELGEFGDNLREYRHTPLANTRLGRNEDSHGSQPMVSSLVIADQTPSLRTPTALRPTRYYPNVMFSMFVLWIIVFAGIFRRARWTIPVAVAAMLWSLVLLKLHMTDPIPLNF